MFTGGNTEASKDIVCKKGVITLFNALPQEREVILEQIHNLKIKTLEIDFEDLGTDRKKFIEYMKKSVNSSSLKEIPSKVSLKVGNDDSCFIESLTEFDLITRRDEIYDFFGKRFYF